MKRKTTKKKSQRVSRPKKISDWDLVIPTSMGLVIGYNMSGNNPGSKKARVKRRK